MFWVLPKSGRGFQLSFKIIKKKKSFLSHFRCLYIWPYIWPKSSKVSLICLDEYIRLKVLTVVFVLRTVWTKKKFIFKGTKNDGTKMSENCIFWRILRKQSNIYLFIIIFESWFLIKSLFKIEVFFLMVCVAVHMGWSSKWRWTVRRITVSLE